MPPRIYLSPPHMSGEEIKLIHEAFDDNWIAPVGPHVSGFEAELAEYVGSAHAVALASGTAGIHLALLLLGIEAGDEVVVSDLTFIGSVNPVRYVGATPVFIDSERTSWNMDPALLADFLAQRAKVNRLPKAVIIVHLYGQSADMDAICAICTEYGVPVIEDAAEAMGTTYKGRHAGTMGVIGVFSFNGNKIITTSGGGMLISDDETLSRRAHYLATQAREPVPHYEHVDIGYNYRLSNILAGIGRAQLRVLEDRVSRRRETFVYYQTYLGDLPGVDFMPEADWGRHTRWLSIMTLDPSATTTTSEQIRLALEAENIESRPVWKPMHMQSVFAECEMIGGAVSEDLFERGLCLPSGTALTDDDLARIVSLVRAVFD